MFGNNGNEIEMMVEMMHLSRKAENMMLKLTILEGMGMELLV
jgi:hypothetical protein